MIFLLFTYEVSFFLTIGMIVMPKVPFKKNMLVHFGNRVMLVAFSMAQIDLPYSLNDH